jgi:hypothetical protein
MSKIISMGHFTAIGMRTKVEDPNALVINTCGKNDLAEIGDDNSWAWSNPTNRAITHPYEDIEAVSLECLWQGTKLLPGQTRPDPEILNGNWRKNKGKRPAGAYAGPNKPLLCSPGLARRTIYIPAFRNLVEHWLKNNEVAKRVAKARAHDGHGRPSLSNRPQHQRPHQKRPTLIAVVGLEPTRELPPRGF